MHEHPDLCRLSRELDLLRARPELLERAGAAGQAVLQAAARLADALRRRERQAVKERDRDLCAEAAIRSGSPAPAAPELHAPRRCYVCDLPFTRRHAFYESLCPACGEEHFARRGQSADLAGRVALVTGGRVRIGFRVALKLLRAGAEVLVTTRFPHDAARRFAAEADSAAWAARLRLHGLDLRALPLVEAFADRLAGQLPHLDVLINNAAQTVRRPPAAYRHLVAGERAGEAGLPPAARAWVQATAALLPGAAAPAELPWSAALTQLPLLPGDEQVPPAEVAEAVDEADGLPADGRASNSWEQTLADVNLLELVEVQLVNALAPFVLLRRLVPALRRSPHPLRFVVNVTSREGQFSAGRDAWHPHTNMAKASLNMLTRTCAADLARHGVLVNSVDPGLVSHQGTAERVRRREEQGRRPPLDAEDGAARVCAPVFTALRTGQAVWGQLFKDFEPVPW
jgi:NAD(P)-dependent dehydrogenase (short-subunit alcohol dehydrogenase family)